MACRKAPDRYIDFLMTMLILLVDYVHEFDIQRRHNAC